MLNKILKPFDLIEQFLRRFKFIIFLLIAINVINSIDDIKTQIRMDLYNINNALNNPVKVEGLNDKLGRVADSVHDIENELYKIRNGQRN